MSRTKAQRKKMSKGKMIAQLSQDLNLKVKVDRRPGAKNRKKMEPGAFTYDLFS